MSRSTGYNLVGGVPRRSKSRDVRKSRNPPPAYGTEEDDYEAPSMSEVGPPEMEETAVEDLQPSKRTKCYNLSIVFQGLVAVLMLGSSITLFVLGNYRRTDTNPTGGLDFFFINGIELDLTTHVYIYYFLSTAAMLFGIIVFVELIQACECTNNWMFKLNEAFHRDSAEWNMRLLIRDLSIAITWWAVDWSLNQSAGEADGKALIGNAIAFFMSLSMILVARFISRGTGNRVTGKSPTDDAINNQYMFRALVVCVMCTCAIVAVFWSQFCRWLNYVNVVQTAGFKGRKTDGLLAAHILFTVAYDFYVLAGMADAVKSMFQHFPVPLKIVFGPYWLVGKIFGPLMNRREMEACIVSILNVIVLIVVPWLLYVDIIQFVYSSSVL